MSEELDIHNMGRRLSNALNRLKNDGKIWPENKEKILEFVKHCSAQDLSIGRQLFYLQRLTIIASILRDKKFIDTSREDVECVLSEVNKRRTRKGAPINSWTKRGYKVAVKVFWRWMRRCGEDEDPPEAAWIKIKVKETDVLPEDLLNKDEVLRMLRVAEHLMHKAMVTTQNELAGRPLELLTMRIKDVEFDQYSAVVRVWGKKKPRRVRLVLATPALRQWLEIHPRQQDPNAPLWICLEGRHAGESLSYDRARKLLQSLAEKAGVKKRVNPYKFRHSTITALAGELTEAEMCEVFGWKQGSRMPRIYVHLSGRDVDDKILRIHGLINENEVEKKILEVRCCPRCKTENPPEGRFCTICAAPLDTKTALELDKHRGAADETMNLLLQDVEVQQLLKRKLLEFGLVEKLKNS